LSSLDTLASMALAVKDIPLKKIVFVAYPGGAGTLYGVGGVIPNTGAAQPLVDAIKNDQPVVVTGGVGGGVFDGEDVDEPTPTADPSAPATIAPDDGEDVKPVELPSVIQGQAATEETCTNGNTF
jgi:hypothetical protein